jgi:murein DD-endopeptidase MepM/ murein hydrolase activator NlpD
VIREQQLQLKSYASKRKEKESVLHEIKKNKKRFAAQIRLVQKKQFQLQAKIESLIMAQQELIDKERERERLRELQKQRDRQRRMLEAKRREEDRQRRLALDKQSGSRKNAVSDDKETGPDQESPGKSFREKSGAEQMRLVPDDTAVEIERVSADFDKTYGRLPWPVRNGVVIRRFGTQRDRDLNIVTTSNGIDISVPDNSPVRAVSGGKVAQIAYLPTFGNIVIVRHPKSYLTVYANLARVTVAKGEFIQSQHMIGSSGAMTEGGSIVHFEIWKGKAKQNPEKWLRN